MPERIAVARGMRDLPVNKLQVIRHIEKTFEEVLTAYAYQPIRLPILEQTSLFSRGLGESTDAVSKEMFVFEGETSSLALRPEGTASCVRAVIAEGLQLGTTKKLWYNGSMFRYERPQRGRYREFYQVGAEAIGLSGPDVDGELIQLVEDILNRLDLRQDISLEINTLGSLESRINYRQKLVEYFSPLSGVLDGDSQRRLVDNPLRILDSKNARVQELVHSAPKVWDSLDEASKKHFEELRTDLDRRGIEYQVNSTLVRGLDYYTHGVFEWNTDRLGAQRQVGGGGRYDGLSELLGGPSVPAAGFAMGIDRLALLFAELNENALSSFAPDLYILALTDAQQDVALRVADEIRKSSSLIVQSHFGSGKVKARMRSADRSGAKFALIIGEEEASQNNVSVKCLREDRDQVTLPMAELVPYLQRQTTPT